MPVIEKSRFVTIHKAGQAFRVPADRQFYMNFLMQSQFHSRIATLADRIERLIQDRGAITRFDRKEFYEAAGLCVFAHKDAIREVSGIPYADHPTKLVEREVDLFHVTDKGELIAGLLHDVPEDTHFDLDFIKKRFGPEVANLVDGLTKIQQLEKDQPINEENIDKFVNALSRDIRTLRLKMSDRGINLEDIEERGEASRLKNCQEALDFYVPLGVLCGFMRATRHLSDIAFKKLYPERYREIEETIGKTVKKNQDLLDRLKKTIIRKYRKTLVRNFSIELLNSPQFRGYLSDKRIEILTKPRTVYEVDQIATMRGTEVRDLSDIVMMQVTVDTEEDCYAMVGIIHSLGEPDDHHSHDYLRNPKINGYQSLHTAIRINGTLVRFQIRTHKMQRVAQEGILYNAFTLGGKFVQPDLPWLKADWLKIILQVRDRRSKILLIKSLSQARKARVLVEGPSTGPSIAATAQEVLLPKGISPLEIAFIVDPNLGIHLVGAFHRDNPLTPNETIEGDIGFIKLIVSDTLIPHDYSNLRHPLARLRFDEISRQIPLEFNP
jgi:GTP pyrophosphokinase